MVGTRGLRVEVYLFCLVNAVLYLQIEFAGLARLDPSFRFWENVFVVGR